MGNKKTAKNNDNEKTKKVKTVKGNNKKEKKAKKKGKHPKLMLALKIFLFLFVTGIIVAAGVVAGIFFGFFGDDLKISADELKIKTENSVLVDLNGNIVATLNGDENREVIPLSEMGEYLPKAFVAIEDKRFYEHSGVDIKRTLGAVTQYVTGNSSYGGSTITQQLIKNATGDKGKDWQRKVREIAKAFQIEREMSKDQILESYLNTIPLGGGAKNVYGVKVASKYYFDKAPTELTIAQAAYIAGINHSPNLYNPFKEEPNMERINERTRVVLNQMIEQGMINQEQYDAAIQEVDAGIAFKEGNITSNNTLTQTEEAAVQQVAREYAEEHDMEYKVALQNVQSSGYKIYITENKELQNKVDETYTTNESWIKTKEVTRKDENGNKYKETVQLQSAMVIIDHKTGYVVASRGVLGEKTPWGTNRVTEAGHQPGSSIKPIAVIAPSIQEGLITAGTVVDDTPVSYGSYSPRNSGGGYNGLMNIRSILRISQNIPEVKMMRKLTPAKSMEYLESFGVSTLTEGDEGLALALGGVGEGITPLEMAGAYATIANDGVYIEPTFYIRVEDSNGKVVMEKEQETHRVLSEQNAWIVQSLLTEPTGTGLTGASGATGTRARVSGMQTCGKTGTTNDTTATWFCGFTPYYAAAMYFGFDEPKDGGSGVPGSGTVASRWGIIMNNVHKGLDSANFDKPSGIVTARVCNVSGQLASENCEQDPRGSRVYSEYYAKGTAPSKTCTTHVKIKVCKETLKVANEFCEQVEEKVYITRPNSKEDTSWQRAADAQLMAPAENCDKHTKKADTEKPVITLKGITKDTVEVKLNTKFTMPEVTVKDNVDGDLSKNVKTVIKKDGKEVKSIDTSKTGTYTITYTVADAAGNIENKTITVKVVKEEQKPNNTNTVNTNTTTTNTTSTSTSRNTVTKQ